MFRKLFAARSSRPLAPHPSRRLELESLEDRLAPATLGGLLTNPLSYSGNLGPSPALALGSLGSSLEGYSVGALGVGTLSGVPPSGAYGSTAGAAASTTSIAAAASQLAFVESVIGSLYQMASVQNPQLAASLAVDVFYQAIDIFALSQSAFEGIPNTTLADSLAGYQNAIALNPLAYTPVGALLGTLVYDTTLYLLASDQVNGTTIG